MAVTIRKARTAPKTETMSISQVRKELASALDRVRSGEERIVVEKSGIPVGALVSLDALEVIRRQEKELDRMWASVNSIREAFKDVPIEEIEEELAQAKRERLAAMSKGAK